jgi:hypothetical protein
VVAEDVQDSVAFRLGPIWTDHPVRGNGHPHGGQFLVNQYFE